MRIAALVSIVALLSTAVVACAPSGEEQADDSAANLTGGSKNAEPSTVFLFDSADTNLSPKCVGALIGPTLAITSRTCAKVGMTVGRAKDKDGKGTERTTVKALNTPPGDDVAITVIELVKTIGGTPAVITHAPLGASYTVQSWASKDDAGGFLGWGSMNKGQSAEIAARLTAATDQFSTLVPEKDQTLCAGDLGAAVCSEKSGAVKGGSCGLAGIVIAPDAPMSPAEVAAGGCTGAGWKVAPVGRHADFLKKLAPKAFQPIEYSLWPDWTAKGLWGYESSGTVAQCKITTANLTAAPANGAVPVKGSASFSTMAARAVANAHFGIALKDKPEEITWWPAKSTVSNLKGNAFDAAFEGSVTAGADGDYIVMLRTSANGGETWSLCDLAGKTDKVSSAKALPLVVGTAADKPTSPDGTTVPEGTTPTKPVTSTTGGAAATKTDYADSQTDLPETESDPNGEDVAPPVAKKTSAAGCSSAPGTSPSSFGLAGILLGLVAIARRRSRT